MSGVLEIEQAVLGGILLRNDLMNVAAKKLTSADFIEGVHAQIFDICSNLIGAGKLANPLTIKPFLSQDIVISGDVTLSVYIARLAGAAATFNEFPHLVVAVRDLADRRTIAGIAEEIARPGDADPAFVAAWGIEQLDAIVAARSEAQSPSLSIQQSVARALEDAAAAYQRDGAITGMSYGLHDLDRKTSGLQRGELTILAGRPGQGKTLLALNFARRFCQAELRGVFFSLEMKDVSLSRRMISDMIFDVVDVPHSRMKSGRFKEEDFRLMKDAAEQLAGLPLQIEQQSGLTISQMAARARQLKQRGGLDFMIVDHMGHVSPSDRYRGNKVNEVGEVSSGLLRLARELDIGLIALAQLNRSVETRDDKRPNLSDLRASGNIEEDAAIVMMVYRESYYLQGREPKPNTAEYELWQTQMAESLHDLDIRIEKNRDGSTGTVKAYVDVACNAVRPEGWTRGYTPNADDLLNF